MSQFNFPELNFDLSFLSPQIKNEAVIIGERRYHLNKSKCKFVSVGIGRDYGYEPCISIMGTKKDVITFNEEEWEALLQYQGVITNYLYSNVLTEPISKDQFSIFFEKISSTKVIKVWKNNSSVYLGYETVCKLWELLPLIKYRVGVLKIQQFATYYKVLQEGLQSQKGNVFVNASNVLKCTENCPTENVCLVQEIMYMYPDIFEGECSFGVRRNEEASSIRTPPYCT